MPAKPNSRKTLVLLVVAAVAAFLGGDIGRAIQAAVNAVAGAY